MPGGLSMSYHQQVDDALSTLINITQVQCMTSISVRPNLYKPSPRLRTGSAISLYSVSKFASTTLTVIDYFFFQNDSNSAFCILQRLGMHGNSPLGVFRA